MTEPQTNQSPYQGISGPGGNYAPVQDQTPYGAQNPYGQAPQNPYGQPPQNPYGNGGAGNYGPPPKKSRKPVLLYVRLAVVAVMVVGGGISDLVNNAHKSHRDSSGAISKGGNLDAVSLRAGDCYERPTAAAAGFDSVKAIPCTQPHNAQAFYVFTYPGATSAAPTDDDLTTNAQPQCENAAKTKVDQTKLPQNAQPSMLYADNSTWAQGYHDITCVYENDTDFTGSIMKS